MRHLLAFVIVVGTALSTLPARTLPLTIKEVTLMLRSGFSSQSVLQELSVRRLAEPFNAGAEKSLREAGAAPALIDDIKNGSYAISPADAQKAKDELAAQAASRAREVEQQRKFNTLYQDKLLRARTAAPPSTGHVSNLLADQLKGDLVAWKNGNLSSLAPFEDEALAKKKLIALYFSAQWCGPCRQFTPQLVEFYNRVAPQHPEFEIVFVSNDRSPGAMEASMRDMKMPWPAIDFAKLPSKGALKKYSGDGIPCLVLLDASGKVVSDSYAGKQRVGPEKVLADLAAMFAQPAAPGIAATR
jgi:thiol-disulfide isomerase/thioredoxin